MPRVDFSWDLKRGIGHRDDFFQNCYGFTSFPQKAELTVWEFVGGSSHKYPKGILLVN